MKSMAVRLGKCCSLLVVLALVASLACGSLPAAAYAETGSLQVAEAPDIAATVDAAPTDAALEADDSAGQQPQVSSITYAGVGLRTRVKMQGLGWMSAENNVVAGRITGNGISSLSIRLTSIQGITGHIKYQTFQRNVGWQTMQSDGVATKSARNVEAVRVKLTGMVSRHYDVLYRTYVSGRGWQPWVKNGSPSGVTGKGVRVSAVQVKLSATTLEAANATKTVDSIGLRYAARLKSRGWQSWVSGGKTAGTVGKSKPLSS